MKMRIKLATSAVIGCTIIAGSIMPAFAQTTQHAGYNQMIAGAAMKSSPAKTDKALMAKFNAALKRGNASEALTLMKLNFGKHCEADNTAMIKSYTAWLEKNQEKMSTQLQSLVEKYSQKAKKDIFTQNKLQMKDLNNPVVMAKAGTLKSQKDLKALIGKSIISGYKLNTSEGMYYFVVDYQRFANLGTKMSSDLAAYLKIMGLQSNKPAILDGGPVITPDEMAKRIADIEALGLKYPKSDYNKALMQMHRELAGMYLFGYTYDFQTLKLNPASLASYKKTVSAYKPYLISDIVSNYLSVVEKNNSKVTDKVQTQMNKLLDEKIGKL